MNLFNRPHQTKSISGEVKKFEDVTQKYKQNSHIAIHANRIKEDTKILSEVKEEISSKLKKIKNDEIKKYKIHTELIEQISILTNNVAQTKEEYFLILDSIKALEESIENGVKEIEKLSTEKQYLDVDILDKSKQKENLILETEELEKKLEEARINFKNYNLDYNQISSQCSEISSLVEKKKSDLNRLSAEVNEVTNKKDAVENKKNALEELYFEINKKIRNFKNDLQIKDSVITQNQSKIYELNREIQKLSTEETSLVELFKEKTELLNKQDDIIKKYSKNIAEKFELKLSLNKKIEEHQQILNKLVLTEDEYNQQLSELNVSNTCSEKKIQELNDNIISTKESIIRTRRFIDHLIEQNKIYESELNELSRSHLEVSDEKIKLEHILNEYKNENLDYSQKLTALKNDYNKTETELSNVRALVSEEEIKNVKIKNEYEILAETISQNREFEAQLKKEYISLIESTQSIEIKINNLTNSKHICEVELQKALNSLKLKTEEVDCLKNKLQKHQSEFDELNEFLTKNKNELNLKIQELNEINLNIRDIENRKEEIILEQQEVHNRNKEVVSELQILVNRKQELEDVLSDKSVVLVALNENNKKLDFDLNSKKNLVKALEEQVSHLTLELSQVEAASGELQKQLADLSTEEENFGQLKHQIEEKNQTRILEIEKIKKTIQSVQEKKYIISEQVKNEEKRGLKLFDDLNNIKNALDVATNDFTQVQVELEKHSQSNLLLMNTLERVKKENEGVKTKVKNTTLNYRKLIEKNKLLESSIDEIELDTKNLLKEAEKAEQILLAEAQRFKHLKNTYKTTQQQYNSLHSNFTDNSKSTINDLKNNFHSSVDNTLLNRSFENFILVNSISKNTVRILEKQMNATELTIAKTMIVSMIEFFNHEELINSEAQLSYQNSNMLNQLTLTLNGLNSSWDEVVSRLQSVKSAINEKFLIHPKTTIKRTLRDDGRLETLIVTWSYKAETHNTDKPLKTRNVGA